MNQPNQLSAITAAPARNLTGLTETLTVSRSLATNLVCELLELRAFVSGFQEDPGEVAPGPSTIIGEAMTIRETLHEAVRHLDALKEAIRS